MSYGEGSIFQITDKKTGKKTWVVEVQLGFKSNGKPRTTRRRAKTHKEALGIRRDLLNQIDMGGIDSQDNIKLAEFGRHWVRNHKSLTLKPSTATDYESRLNRYVFPYLGNKKVRELDFNVANAWINHLVADGFSVNTINGARTIFSQLCKHAMRQGILKTNPLALTDKLRKQIGDKTQVRAAWSLEEAQDVLRKVENTEFDLFINLGLRLGLRHGEILGLNWDSINLEENEIKITQILKDERRLDEAGNGIVRLRLQTPKTSASKRTLKITDQLKDSIVRHQMYQSVLKAKAQEKWKESGMVFTTAIGTAKSQANNYKRYKDLLEKLGIRFIRVHDLRHTYAELGLEAGAPLEAVSQSLGHADIGITKKLYAPDVRGLNAKAIDTLDAFLNPDISIPQHWILGEEPKSASPIAITDPVQLSKRPSRTRLMIRGENA
jgi:integrase